MKETIQTAAESFLPALWAISRAMYDHPELGLEEVNSSRMLREWLAEQGFKVEENFHGLPTAFRAVYGSGRPVLGFLCEYDALPEVGHGCGHDLIGVVSAGAAAVLRQTVDAVGGTLIVYGTPDEEVTCTKVQLTDEGAFDELDVALMLHPYQKTCGRMGSIGIYPVQYEFFGKKCHANEAGPGSDCINALDAAVAAYLSVNQVKQYLDANIYGILNSGGTLPNIIPDYASLRYYIRCDQEWKTRRAVERINRCVQGAADSMGAELKITQYLCPTQPLLLNEPLLDAYEANMAALGEPVVVEEANRLSTDAGNVSFRIPTLHGMLGIHGCGGVDLHTEEFAARTVTEEGWGSVPWRVWATTCSPGLSCWRLSGPTSSGASGNRTRKEFHHHAVEKFYHGGQDYLGGPEPPGAPPGGGRHSCVRYPLRRRGQLPLRHL